ncbi:MAG: hypothetical protein WC044_14460 [Crocinitomicaceae bacterium]
MRLGIILILLGLITMVACKKDKNNATYNLHTDYFPLTEGRFIIYDVSEMIHDQDISQHDTAHYWLKTVVGQEYIDNSGRTARELIRYKSVDSGISWQTMDVWTSILDGNRAETVEENQRLLKLVFAPTSDKEWDINVYNTGSKQNAHYTSIHVPFSLNAFQFDSTIRVEQANYFTLVDFKNQTEVYAKGIGLVQKTFKDLEIQNFDTLNVQKGKELYLNCISFGFE